MEDLLREFRAEHVAFNCFVCSRPVQQNSPDHDNSICDENGENCDTAGNSDIAEYDDNDDIRIPKLDTDNNINKAKPTKVAKVKEDQSINLIMNNLHA